MSLRVLEPLRTDVMVDSRPVGIGKKTECHALDARAIREHSASDS